MACTWLVVTGLLPCGGGWFIMTRMTSSSLLRFVLTLLRISAGLGGGDRIGGLSGRQVVRSSGGNLSVAPSRG